MDAAESKQSSGKNAVDCRTCARGTRSSRVPAGIVEYLLLDDVLDRYRDSSRGMTDPKMIAKLLSLAREYEDRARTLLSS